LGRQKEFEERKGSNQRIQKGISARHGRCGITRMQRSDVQARRIAREVYGKDIIRMVGQKV